MNSRINSASAIPLLFLAGALAWFAFAFVGAAGLGIPLAYNAADLYLHDTYYVLAHFYPVVVPGAAFVVFAAVYYWFPNLTGRKLNQALGITHFFLSSIFAAGAFFPFSLMGSTGVHRRWYDGGTPSYGFVAPAIHWNTSMSISLLLLAAAQFIFFFNLVWSVLRRRGAA